MLTPSTPPPVDYYVVYNVSGEENEVELKKDILVRMLNAVYGDKSNYLEIKDFEKNRKKYNKYKDIFYVKCLSCPVVKNQSIQSSIRLTSQHHDEFKFSINNKIHWSVQVSKINDRFAVVKNDAHAFEIEDCAFLKINACKRTQHTFAHISLAHDWKEKIKRGRPTRFIHTGVPIEKHDFKIVEDISKGDSVDLILQTGPIKIKSKAKALSSGSTSEMIKVQMPFASKHAIQAKVVGKGVVVYDQSH